MTAFADLMPHLVVLPLLLPMLTAALMLIIGEGKHFLKIVLGMTSATIGLAHAIACVVWVDAHGTVVYLPGNWTPPFGIMLAMDRLSAMMLFLTWLLGAGALLFASARWHRAGVHFHALIQLQLMGLSGAFLTADVFNLFVFFEILLAASYGLMLHGSGQARVKTGLHYIAMNLAASSLFLIGAAIIYGVTGTLNMAELSARLSSGVVRNRHLIDTGAAILAVAFLLKAGAWPLNFWLSPAYGAASPPVAGLFAVLTKVGVYALIRMWTLMFAGGPLAGFGAEVLFGFGALSAVLASFGMLSTGRLQLQASWAVVMSAGTLLAALGLGDVRILGSALYYLVASTVGCSLLFLLVDLIQRWRAGGTPIDKAPFLNAALESTDINLDDEGEPLVTLPFPASTALLGLAFFACVLIIAGLPPFATFVGKVGMLAAVLGRIDMQGPVARRAWIFTAFVLVSGLLALVAMSRSGIRAFWSQLDRETPRVRVAEGVPVVTLLGIAAAFSVFAGPALTYAHDTAAALYEQQSYIRAVLDAKVTSVSLEEAPR